MATRFAIEINARMDELIRLQTEFGKLRAGMNSLLGMARLGSVFAAAGVTPPAGAKLDGLNLLPAWKGEAALPERALFWRFNFPPGREELYKNAIREGDWKLVKNWECAADGQRSAGTPKLIDLSKDIAETSDQSAAQPDRTAALRGKWERWNEELAEPFDGQERVKERKEKNRAGARSVNAL
jgi:hypothetical protein